LNSELSVGRPDSASSPRRYRSLSLDISQTFVFVRSSAAVPKEKVTGRIFGVSAEEAESCKCVAMWHYLTLPLTAIDNIQHQTVALTATWTDEP
jgi:hypothetical protein